MIANGPSVADFPILRARAGEWLRVAFGAMISGGSAIEAVVHGPAEMRAELWGGAVVLEARDESGQTIGIYQNWRAAIVEKRQEEMKS